MRSLKCVSSPKQASSGTSCRVVLIALLFVVTAIPAAAAVSNCAPDQTDGTGNIYRICMPAEGLWNGELVVFAHGLVPFNEPVHIPEEQLVLFDGVSIPQLANALGYGFAVTSYRKTGLAVQDGIQDLRSLVSLFTAAHGAPARSYLVGPSEGGLIAALAVERYPETFSGGIAACGYVGDFRRHIDYTADFRVLFDYFFPGVLPGDAASVPDDLISNWTTDYAPAIVQALGQDPAKMQQLITTARVPIVSGMSGESLVKIVAARLWDHMISTNNNREVLGGQPYDNRNRTYAGSTDDTLLNLSVQRFDAEASALQEMAQHYQTTGVLTAPVVTLHNTSDHMIPYWQAQIYRLKTLVAGSGAMHVNLPISRYGHCRYQWNEVLLAFLVLVNRANAAGPTGVIP